MRGTTVPIRAEFAVTGLSNEEQVRSELQAGEQRIMRKMILAK